MPKRKYRIIHEPYIVEWLMKTYPPGVWSTNVRVGRPRRELIVPGLRPEEVRMLRIYTGRADAIVLLPDKVAIVEAMIRSEPGKIQMLKTYARLFRMTEEFREHWEKPIGMVLLTPLDEPFITRMAREEGIRVVYYRPEWIITYIETLPGRLRRGRLYGAETP